MTLVLIVVERIVSCDTGTHYIVVRIVSCDTGTHYIVVRIVSRNDKAILFKQVGKLFYHWT